MRVHDSKAYRKMDVTRERIRCILELREILSTITQPIKSNNILNQSLDNHLLHHVNGIYPAENNYFLKREKSIAKHRPERDSR